ncbi:MAG: uracil-DNA glycosylase [Desulfobulbales bacterium]|nr:uracil-DNA glycosylase [Desulfobulbales bacterium]
MKQEIRELLETARNTLRFHERMGLGGIPLTGGIERFLTAAAPPPSPPRPPGPVAAKQPASTTPGGALYTPAPAAAINLPLSEIYQDLEGCTGCPLHENRRRIVPGCGPAGARLFIIEDQPAAAEEETGRPFAGEAGELLDKMLKAIDLDRTAVYLTSIVKCRPAEDREPNRAEIRTCLNFLARQIAAVNPVIICTMGPLAARVLTGNNQSLFRFRGRLHDFHTIPLIPSFHPGFLLKNPEMKKGSWADLQLIRKKID